jgi:hypothetical protein
MRSTILGAAVLLVLLCSRFLPPLDAQTVEVEARAPVLQDSTHSSEQRPCYPPCREGYICHDGQCVSLCNPPCQQGSECGKDGNCHMLAASMRKQLEAIVGFAVVPTREDVAQGIIVTTNRPGTRVKIGDSTFVFDRELCLVTAVGEYTIAGIAPSRYPCRKSVTVRSGAVERVEFGFWPFRISMGPSFGCGFRGGDSAPLQANFDMGVDVFALHYVGLAGTYAGEWQQSEKHLDRDTVRTETSSLRGGGITYGYMGLQAFESGLTIAPQLSLGYWRHDSAVYYRQKTGTIYSDNLGALEQHHYVRYYVRPGVEVRVGRRMVAFRAWGGCYVGEETPILALAFGFLVRVP